MDLRERCRSQSPVVARAHSLLERRQLQACLDCFDSPIGRYLLKYEVLEKIGQGAVGTVYKARDSLLNRFVVLKVLAPQLLVDAEMRRRFLEEARCLSALQHPGIVTIYDLAQDQGRTFIVMEYVAGETLAKRIPARGIAVNRLLRYACQIASALATAHYQGVIHRDLKPSNILVSACEQIKIIDFGLAADIQITRTERFVRSGPMVGTPGYTAPEQARGRTSDPRSDIFSFGVVLYEMLTGLQPFKRAPATETIDAILHDEPRPITKPLPASLIDIVRRCLKKDPKARFRTMNEVITSLTAVSTDLDPNHSRRDRWS